MMEDYGVNAPTMSHISSNVSIDHNHQHHQNSQQHPLDGSGGISLSSSRPLASPLDVGPRGKGPGDSILQQPHPLILTQSPHHQQNHNPPDVILAAQHYLSSMPESDQSVHNLHQHPPHPGHNPHPALQYGFHQDPQSFSPLRTSATPLALSTQRHQTQSAHHESSICSPTNFTTTTVTSLSDQPYSSPSWPGTQQTQLVGSHLQNKGHPSENIVKCVTGTENNRNFALNKLITMPYRLDFSDSIAHSAEDYSSLSLSFSNLDSAYALATSQNFNNQEPRPSSTPQFPLRRALQPVANNEQHLVQSNYLSRATSPSLNRVYHHQGRQPLSPSESFTHLVENNPQLPPHSEPVPGQKRKNRPLDISADFPVKSRRSSLSPDHTPVLSASPIGLDSGHHRMTTVLCLHASVAQKSYGQEKRFLCPPPLVRITGPYRQLSKAHRPVLSMSILNEQGDQHLCQTAYIGEDDTNVHFKSLHISGAAKKAKNVTLELSLHAPCQNFTLPTHNNGPEIEEVAPPFATFRSTECNIISKPSKKTAKARNTQSCIFNGSTICLFNRINSQTVRTKYLCVQNGMLAARAAQWSAFIIKVVRRAEEPGADGTPPIAAKTLLSSSIPGADRTVTYGSEVELIDFVTGVSSGPLVVRKVEKNKVQKDATGPVSQMQKLAFCQIDRTNGSALYITALDGVSAVRPSASISEEKPALESNPQLENGDFSAISLGLPQTSAQPAHQRLHMLQLQPPRAVLPPEERGGMTFDEIDDSVAWTVIGVAHFSHTFFDLSHHYPQIPLVPITPFPALTCRPSIDLHTLTMTIKITGFFDAQARAMEVWLGPLGALNTSVLSTTGITLGPGAKNEEGANNSTRANGVQIQMSQDLGGGIQPGRASRQETSLLVNMPSLESIYWTLHHSHMPPDVVVAMEDASRRSIQPSGYPADGGKENTPFSSPDHIPALPITLIRPDGMSFMMGNSICLSKAPQDLKQDEQAQGTKPENKDRKSVCVLKVI